MESGWGINFAHQADIIFASWFTYDHTGNDWWLTMTASEIVTGVYSGTLYATTGSGLQCGTFRPDTGEVNAGRHRDADFQRRGQPYLRLYRQRYIADEERYPRNIRSPADVRDGHDRLFRRDE